MVNLYNKGKKKDINIIDYNKFHNKFINRYPFTIYFSKICNYELLGTEVLSARRLLQCLYELHLVKVKENLRLDLGISYDDIHVVTGLCYNSIGLAAWKFIPFFINIKTSKGKHITRYLHLNERGVRLVKKMYIFEEARNVRRINESNSEVESRQSGGLLENESKDSTVQQKDV